MFCKGCVYCSVSMLTVSHIAVARGDQMAVKDISLTVAPGTVTAVMGPNGSGKSTLAMALSGVCAEAVVTGEALFRGKNLLAQSTDERARNGMFLAYQNPVALPGVSVAGLLRAAASARGDADMEGLLQRMHAAAELLELPEKVLTGSVHGDASGGEKKKLELLQMLVLQPKLVLLDEIDSGLDIDALAVCARAIQGYRSPKRSIVMITHYARLLHMVPVDCVHVLLDGRIVRTGGMELAEQIEAAGYEGII